MIEAFCNLRCDECREVFLDKPWNDDQIRLLLLTAELAGWKVYRLAKDVYYGKAWCTNCRPDKCKRCWGRGYYPDFSNWNEHYGEPAKKDCEVCEGRKYV